MRNERKIESLASEPWTTFAPTSGFTLPAGDGDKTVYAQYRDAVGNETRIGDPGTLDAIILDTTGPSVAAGAVLPLEDATDVSLSTTVSATFTEANALDE